VTTLTLHCLPGNIFKVSPHDSRQCGGNLTSAEILSDEKCPDVKRGDNNAIVMGTVNSHEMHPAMIMCLPHKRNMLYRG